MFSKLTQFLNKPFAEDFSLRNQLFWSAQVTLYCFVFIEFFLNFRLIQSPWPHWVITLLFAGMVGLMSFLSNHLTAVTLPQVYQEDRWTVGKQIIHTLYILFCVSVGNQLVLMLLDLGRPPFLRMYYTVTVIGFFPVVITAFLAERRRLMRHLSQAKAANTNLHYRQAESAMVEQKEKVQEAESSQARLPELLSPVPAIVLQSDTSSASLTLRPDQIRYVESVANYVDVHWVDGAGDWHKTTLRNTLKNLEKAFAVYPQLFRCHRAFIVNLNTIDLVEGNAQGYRLTLVGTTQLIPVSRSYLAEFDTRVASK